MKYMTKAQEAKCHGIIHGASAGAGAIGAGLAQLPMSDSVAIAPLQVTMVISLGAVFGLSLSGVDAEAVIAPALGTLAGRGLSQVLVGWIPIAGNIINATTAAGLTETLGWIVAKDFARRAAERGDFC